VPAKEVASEAKITDPTLRALAVIVRGADTDDRDLTPESSGLYAAATGFQARAGGWCSGRGKGARRCRTHSGSRLATVPGRLPRSDPPLERHAASTRLLRGGSRWL